MTLSIIDIKPQITLMLHLKSSVCPSTLLIPGVTPSRGYRTLLLRFTKSPPLAPPFCPPDAENLKSQHLGEKSPKIAQNSKNFRLISSFPERQGIKTALDGEKNWKLWRFEAIWGSFLLQMSEKYLAFWRCSSLEEFNAFWYQGLILFKDPHVCRGCLVFWHEKCLRF